MPILLVYPGYLERFTGKRPVFLVLVISILSLVWIPVWGLMVADLDFELKQPFVAESGILYFISFNLLYAYVFKLYEKMGFYGWMKRMQGSFFYNDPSTHIRDFDKTASIYISTVLVVLVFVLVTAFSSYWERRRWNKQLQSAPVRESQILVPQLIHYRFLVPKAVLKINFPDKPQYVVDFNQLYPHKLYKIPFTSYSRCYNLRKIVVLS